LDLIGGGNPAKAIRKRFDEETTHFLVKLQWWDWPAQKITKNLEALATSDIDALKRTFAGEV
jgi:virginiamycin A acetyltransferase